MNAKMTQPSDEVRLRILEAATQRFAPFGYNKATMVEVAQDCGMSVANLYRYFENKLDIGANLACLSIKRERMPVVVHQHENSAQQYKSDGRQSSPGQLVFFHSDAIARRSTSSGRRATMVAGDRAKCAKPLLHRVGGGKRDHLSCK
ncbi:Transcriptional regulator, AcrR family [hydrothermal vent metagenome]|uniref:Transcriptional regulator, AcrR family n=1 Tax=hydrothermal vent metagenome TaxID=652676 RepID=A0A3B0Z7J6_9ZZZZ